MDALWIGYIVGGIQWFLVGSGFGFLAASGKAFFYRFVLKKTPVEPVIIDTGKISVPTLKIVDNKFEYEGVPYIAPPGSMTPKSIMVGSVSAVYLKGTPMPLYITQNTVGFKLTDNTILSDVMRSIFSSDSLRKLFTKEKITNAVLAMLIILAIVAVVINIQMVMSISKLLPQFIDQFNSAVETMRGAFAEYLGPNASSIDTTNPQGPTAVPPPGGS